MCSANVVKQFARVARSTDFLYCYAIIEANRRSEYHSTLPNSSGSQTNQGALPPTALLPILRDSGIDKELNTFFPFDPYKLPQSHSYIEGIYREWASVAIEEILEEDEDEDEDEDEEEDEESESVGSHMVIGSLERWNSTEELGRSFGGMSISPARPPPPPPFLAV
jgi:RNA polymerase I-specific transcription initiation factor RRN3